MRIISGIYKGFKFPEHKLSKTRPTTDRAKEALMSILNARINLEGVHALDLYSGTGNIGFELLSQGAESVESVEFHRAAVEYQKKVSVLLGAELQITRAKVIDFLKRTSKTYDLIFADPPYISADYQDLINLVRQKELLKSGGLLIVEHGSNNPIPTDHLLEQRSYGQSTFSFFTFENYE